MTYVMAERFEIPRVLSRMFGVISRNFAVFAALALVLSGLPSLMAALVERGVGFPFGFGLGGVFGLGWIVTLLVSTLLQGALIHGTISDLNGRPASLGDCLATAIRNVLPLIGIAIATTVATFVGLLLFVVPGVILALALCVSAPAQVVENHGVFAALSRSSDLTRNHRWTILLLFVLFAVGFSILRRLIGEAHYTNIYVDPTGATHITAAGGLWTVFDTIRLLVVTPLLQAFSALVGAAGIASIYFELRTIKEGVGVEALAKAFE